MSATDHDTPSSPAPSPGGEPAAGNSAAAELLTLPEAAQITRLSVKALTRRIERGTLPSEIKAGRRIVRRGELERLQLIGGGNPAEEGGSDPAGEIVIWREMYDREQAAHQTTREDLTARMDEERRRGEEAIARAEQLRVDLAAIANAGPIRAWTLRREQRRQLRQPPQLHE